MAETQRRKSNRHKIEPLNYAEAALSPALKGMTSFLDVSPENVRNQDFHEFGPVSSSTGVASAALDTGPGDETTPGPATLPDTSHGFSVVTPITARKQLYVEDIATEGVIAPEVVKPPGDETTPGHLTSYDAAFPPDSYIRRPRSVNDMRPGDETTPGTLSTPGPLTARRNGIWGVVTPPGDETTSGLLTSDESAFSPDCYIQRARTVNDMSPGDETTPGVLAIPGRLTSQPNGAGHVTPGRGRSKIRRCVLAQDGHSLGEEAIYQALWRTGRPESGDPNGSRTNRMGAADIGFKVNMAKKNVRQNISRLFEKLALEIIEDFETINSQARLYRIYSYKQILERRRAAGLEYVLRNKGVVFCTKDGTELVSSPAYVSSPGHETKIQPARPKKRRNGISEAPRLLKAVPAQSPIEQSDEAELQLVSVALNRYWPVDESAAAQLLRACRKVRADARAEEVAFFVQEKLEISRNNRNITNPTGLIIATVPQSFVGSAFDEFRRRLERQAKLEAEEVERKRQDHQAMVAWINRDRARYEATVSDPTKNEMERDTAERRLREISAWEESYREGN